MNYRSGASWTNATDMDIYKQPEQRKDKGAPGWVGPAALATAAGAGLFLLSRGKVRRWVGNQVKEAVKDEVHGVKEDIKFARDILTGKTSLRDIANKADEERIQQAMDSMRGPVKTAEPVGRATHIDLVPRAKKPRNIVDADYTPVVEEPKVIPPKPQYDKPIGPRLPTMREMHEAEGIPIPLEPKARAKPLPDIHDLKGQLGKQQEVNPDHLKHLNDEDLIDLHNNATYGKDLVNSEQVAGWHSATTGELEGRGYTIHRVNRGEQFDGQHMEGVSTVTRHQAGNNLNQYDVHATVAEGVSKDGKYVQKPKVITVYQPKQYDKPIGPEPAPPKVEDDWEVRKQDFHEKQMKYQAEDRDKAINGLHHHEARTDDQKLKAKKKYDNFVNSFLDGKTHEVDSDELIPVIHGGNSEAIHAFLRGEHGYPTLQEMPHEAAETLSRQGVMWHSDFTGRAKMYAERTGAYSSEKPGEPAILMGMIPRRHLYENDIGDEFSSPVWHADKIQNAKVIKMSDPEYAKALEHYDQNYLKPTAGKWDRVRADALKETIPGQEVTYGDAAQKLNFDMSNKHKFDPAQVTELKWQIRQAHEKSLE